MKSKQRLDGVAPEFVWQLNQHADRPDLCIILSGDASCEIDGTADRSGVAGPDERASAFDAGLAYMPSFVSRVRSFPPRP
jgi:hypothetical protein